MHHRGQLMLIKRMLGIVPHLTRHMQERMAAASTVPARWVPAKEGDLGDQPFAS